VRSLWRPRRTLVGDADAASHLLEPARELSEEITALAADELGRHRRGKPVLIELLVSPTGT
jgi:hypothetical protein